ncbi:MAG: hypothetical protein JW774_09585 [Candidatus Aureabacteria bacterium]|nr:hypothetical protein [Candidatus Auribacterota bacterium]
MLRQKENKYWPVIFLLAIFFVSRTVCPEEGLSSSALAAKSLIPDDISALYLQMSANTRDLPSESKRDPFLALRDPLKGNHPQTENELKQALWFLVGTIDFFYSEGMSNILEDFLMIFERLKDKQNRKKYLRTFKLVHQFRRYFLSDAVYTGKLEKMYCKGSKQINPEEAEQMILNYLAAHSFHMKLVSALEKDVRAIYPDHPHLETGIAYVRKRMECFSDELKKRASALSLKLAQAEAYHDMPASAQLSGRFDIQGAFQALLNKIKSMFLVINIHDLPVEQEKEIVKSAEHVMEGHESYFRKDGKTPYFAHPMNVVRKLVEIFNITDPIAIQISLFHDVREENLPFYLDYMEKERRTLLSYKGKGDITAQAALIYRFEAVGCGIRLLSRIKKELKTTEMYEYTARLRDPKTAKNGFRIMNARQKQETYHRLRDSQELDPEVNTELKKLEKKDDDDEFIRLIQLIKMSDILANLEDPREFFADFNQKTFKKMMQYYIHGFIETSPYLTSMDKAAFYNEALRILRYQACPGAGGIPGGAQQAIRELQNLLQQTEVSPISSEWSPHPASSLAA